MPSQRLVRDDGITKFYDQLDDAGQVVGHFSQQYVFTPEQQAAQTQQAAVAALLAGAAQLLTNYAAQKATVAAAITALPAAPTAAQVGTFLKGPLTTYLAGDNDTQVAVIKGIANFIANATGNPATF